MRAKEFLMKDSYSFDIDRSNAVRTYEEYVQTYNDLFKTIGVAVKTGNILRFPNSRQCDSKSVHNFS